MIVDAHHHFWDPSRRDYPWMGDELVAIRRLRLSCCRDGAEL